MTSTTSSYELSRADSLALMRSMPVGRIAFQGSSLPTVLTVNIAVADDGVLVRTASRVLLGAARQHLYVVVETDDFSVEKRSGWAVSVVGRAELVTEPLRLGRLDALVPQPWVGGEDTGLVCVRPELVEGRRIGGANAFPSRC